MAQGKVRSALNYLSRERSGGVLGLDDTIPQSNGMTTRDTLKHKHPPGKPACPESLLPDNSETANPIIYSNLDAECILQAALHTHGAAGLSGLDAYAWRRLCSSFKSTICAMLLLLWDKEFAPPTFIPMISVPLLPVG